MGFLYPFRVSRLSHTQILLEPLPLFPEGNPIVPFHFDKTIPILALPDLFQCSRIKENRGTLELKEDKNHRPDKQDDELHRDLGHPIEQQSDPALSDRTPGKIPLDLRLICPKVGEGDEQSTDQPGPEVIAIIEVEGEVHDVQAPHPPCNME